MAAPTKKRALQENSDKIKDESFDEEDNDDEVDDDESDEKDDDNDEPDNEMGDQEIQVDFEGRTAVDSNFHGIKKLLQQVFLKANVNTSELTNTIIGQNYVGSVMKQCGASDEDDEDAMLDADDDEDEVFGLISVINITEKKDIGCMNDIRQLLFDRCKQCASKHVDEFYSLLNEKQIGYLISERFINMPAKLAPPMYTSLKQEIDKAITKKMKFSFDYYLLIAKTYQTKAENKSKSKEVERFFINQEEELFFKASSLWFEYCVTSEKDTVVGGSWDDEEEEFDLYRTVILVPASKIESIIAQIHVTIT